MSIEILSRDMLIFHQNGIELDKSLLVNNGAIQRSRVYEEKCFKTIVQDSESYLIGPRLVDYLLHRGILGTLSRPDAMGFLQTTSEQWTLSELYEFKSGIHGKRRRKLEGFSELLTHLRKRPSYLSNLFRIVLGDNITVPSDIVIPENSKINVTLIMTKKSLTTSLPRTDPRTDFIFTRKSIPFE